MTHVEARRTMSGLEFFRQMLAGEMPPPPMIDLLGIRLAEVEEGRVVFTAHLRGAVLQRHRRRARRLRRDDARHRARLRDQLGDAGRPALHDARAEGESDASDHQGGRPAPLRGERRPRRRPHGDVGRGGSSIATASSTPTARRRASSSTPHAGRWNRRHRNLQSENRNLKSETRNLKSMADLVRYEVKDGVAVVTIDNPPVNALGAARCGRRSTRRCSAASPIRRPRRSC